MAQPFQHVLDKEMGLRRRWAVAASLVFVGPCHTRPFPPRVCTLHDPFSVLFLRLLTFFKSPFIIVDISFFRLDGMLFPRLWPLLTNVQLATLSANLLESVQRSTTSCDYPHQGAPNNCVISS